MQGSSQSKKGWIGRTLSTTLIPSQKPTGGGKHPTPVKQWPHAFVAATKRHPEETVCRGMSWQHRSLIQRQSRRQERVRGQAWWAFPKWQNAPKKSGNGEGKSRAFGILASVTRRHGRIHRENAAAPVNVASRGSVTVNNPPQSCTNILQCPMPCTSTVPPEPDQPRSISRYTSTWPQETRHTQMGPERSQRLQRSHSCLSRDAPELSGHYLFKFHGTPHPNFIGRPDSNFIGSPHPNFIGSPHSNFIGSPHSNFIGSRLRITPKPSNTSANTFVGRETI